MTSNTLTKEKHVFNNVWKGLTYGAGLRRTSVYGSLSVNNGLSLLLAQPSEVAAERGYQATLRSRRKMRWQGTDRGAMCCKVFFLKVQIRKGEDFKFKGPCDVMP